MGDVGRPQGRPSKVDPMVLGIDEAGRGSVLGPLVVGGFLCPSSTVGRLPALGVRDSKLLSPARREEVYASLARVGQRVSIALDPATIDRAVERGGLNRLEAEAFARLVKRYRPDRIELDACDVNAPRFGRNVARLAGFEGVVESRHRADRELPAVGAASIVAKVRRDAALARLKLLEPAIVGSGYPSDRRTVVYLESALRVGAPTPPWVRASWKTTVRVKGHLSERTLESFGR